jgi:hypothetical protein
MPKTASVGEDQKKIAAVVAFVVVAAAIFYFEYFYTGTPSTPAPVATVPAAPPVRTGEASVATAGKAARSLGTTSAGLDPTLHMDAMLVSESVQYAGFGRNIFSPNSAPPPATAIPQPKGPARPQVAVNTAPVAPPAPVPCPPNCPPIDLKFFGVETGSNGARKALLLHGEDVFVASPGEIVMRRYRVVTVDAKTIEVEDMQNNNKQTLPLLVN